MLDTDAERNGAVIGEPLELSIFEPGEIEGQYPRSPIDEVVVVGTYTTPQSDDVWIAARPCSRPPTSSPASPAATSPTSRRR